MTGDIQTGDIICARVDDDVKDGARTMGETQVSRLPMLDKHERRWRGHWKALAGHCRQHRQ